MQSDVIIVGGGPAGVITGLTAKSVYPDKSVTIIKEIGDGVIPCAIPYMMHTMGNPVQNAMQNKPLEQAGIRVVEDRVVSFDPVSYTVRLRSGMTETYEKLVLATGTEPAMLDIPGIERRGVHSIRKSMSSMVELRDAVRLARDVVIIGGGFIGAEFADELSKTGNTTVHLVESFPKLLMSALDDEFCDEVREVLESEGVKIYTDARVSAVEGGQRVDGVTLEDGRRLPADVVLVSVGARPVSGLAAQAGLRIVENNSIWVDDYMRTSAPDVFAVGDCALKRDFFTRRAVPVWLASTATAEARIAGTNLYGIRVLRQIQGTVSAFSTQIGRRSFASSGMTCRAGTNEGFRCVCATAEAPDRHPGVLPGAQSLKVKLIFADRSGILLGGQMSGGPSVGELINAVALAIQKRVTVRELEMMQIATHPMLTPAPTVHPLVNAAHQALAQLRAAVKEEWEEGYAGVGESALSAGNEPSVTGAVR